MIGIEKLLGWILSCRFLPSFFLFFHNEELLLHYVDERVYIIFMFVYGEFFSDKSIFSKELLCLQRTILCKVKRFLIISHFSFSLIPRGSNQFFKDFKRNIMKKSPSRILQRIFRLISASDSFQITGTFMTYFTIAISFILWLSILKHSVFSD